MEARRMLFAKKKKTTGEDQAQIPRTSRYDCVVKVGINGFEGEAVLKNISRGGFLMESKTYAALTVEERYTMQIKPEAISGVRSFSLEVEVRWIQSSETKFKAGFLVVSPPVDGYFEKYLDYIKIRNGQ
jgi:hypothetical protein